MEAKRGRSDTFKCVLGIGVVLLFFVGLARYLDTSLAFNSATWIANPMREERDNVRSRMLIDLLRNHLHAGMTQQQVRKLLGPPDSQSEDDRENNRDVYDLGYIGPMGIDPSFLEIEYDRNGRIISIQSGET